MSNFKLPFMDTILKLYATLQSGEGFSVRPEDLGVYTGGGFAVGGAKDCRVFKVENDTLSLTKFRDVMEYLREGCYDYRTQVIGGWVDDHGVAYLEISDIIQSHFVACELAEYRGELAIFDFNNAKSIVIK